MERIIAVMAICFGSLFILPIALGVLINYHAFPHVRYITMRLHTNEITEREQKQLHDAKWITKVVLFLSITGQCFWVMFMESLL